MMHIDPKIKKYLDTEILPRYQDYDKGHNQLHIQEVAEEALQLAKSYNVSANMVYTAAIFHDLGMIEGRETHHLSSARMLKEDITIQHYFSEQEILIIAEAIEDHRASSKNEPRTIYGAILSAADKKIETNTLIIRSYYYSIQHFPNYSFSEHIQRVYEHLVDKYGENGYLKFPILTEKNKEAIHQLRKLLKDENRFKKRCIDIIEQKIKK